MTHTKREKDGKKTFSLERKTQSVQIIIREVDSLPSLYPGFQGQNTIDVLGRQVAAELVNHGALSEIYVVDVMHVVILRTSVIVSCICHDNGEDDIKSYVCYNNGENMLKIIYMS